MEMYNDYGFDKNNECNNKFYVHHSNVMSVIKIYVVIRYTVSEDWINNFAHRYISQNYVQYPLVCQRPGLILTYVQIEWFSSKRCETKSPTRDFIPFRHAITVMRCQTVSFFVQLTVWRLIRPVTFFLDRKKNNMGITADFKRYAPFYINRVVVMASGHSTTTTIAFGGPIYYAAVSSVYEISFVAARLS